VLLLIRYVLRFLFGPARVVRRPAQPSPKPTERLGGELVRDPNCGTYIPKERAIAVGAGAGIKYFCSAVCRDAYEEKVRS